MNCVAFLCASLLNGFLQFYILLGDAYYPYLFLLIIMDYGCTIDLKKPLYHSVRVNRKMKVFVESGLFPMFGYGR